MFERPRENRPPETLDSSNFASRPETGRGGMEGEGGEPPDDTDLSKHEMPGGFREEVGKPEPPDDTDLSKHEMPGGFRDEAAHSSGPEVKTQQSAPEKQETTPQAQETRDTNG